MLTVQRVAVQLPRAHATTFQKTSDLVREAVGCNGGLGGRADRIPHSNRESNCCTVRDHVWVWSRTVAGRTAGEPATGERCVRPRRCAFTTRNGALGWQRGAFRVRAPAPAFALIIVVWRAARYATALLVRTRRDRCSRLGPPNAMAG